MNTPQHATCAEREDFAQALLIAAEKIRAQRPPSEVTEDMDPHIPFPRAGGIKQSPANTPVPTSPQPSRSVSLGEGGAPAHTGAPLNPGHAVICGECLGYISGDRSVLGRCVPGARIDVAGPCAQCAAPARQLPRVFLNAALIRHLELAKGMLAIGDRQSVNHELAAASRAAEELRRLPQ